MPVFQFPGIFFCFEETGLQVIIRPRFSAFGVEKAITKKMLHCVHCVFFDRIFTAAKSRNKPFLIKSQLFYRIDAVQIEGNANFKPSATLHGAEKSLIFFEMQNLL